VSLDSEAYAIISVTDPKCMWYSCTSITVSEHFLAFRELPVLDVSYYTREMVDYECSEPFWQLLLNMFYWDLMCG